MHHVLAVIAALASAANALSAYDVTNPPEGVGFGAWVDTVQQDRIQKPSEFNLAIGNNAIAFQLPQRIPVIPNDPTNGLANITNLDDGTDAILFLTVYPDSAGGTGIDSVKQSDLDALANQIADFTRTTGRSVMLRYAPEMNGKDWFAYQKAADADFIAHWQNMYKTVKAKNPKNLAVVWSPNLNQGNYEFANKFPGDEYVDWYGMSIYWKGPVGTFPWHVNVEPPVDYVPEIVDGYGSQGDVSNFYQDYPAKYNKPFVISETGAGYVKSYSVGGGPSQAGDGTATQMSMTLTYWDSFLFNQTWLSLHPLFKMAIVFNIRKNENEKNNAGQVYDIDRDYRITVDDATTQAFVDRLNNGTQFVWAVSNTTTSTTSSVPVATSSAGGKASTGASAPVSASSTTTSTSTKGSSGADASLNSVFAAVAAFGAAILSVAALI